ncbi:MAG: hypothetical protein HYT97_00495 [Elusimicrobia bacterium]|nr:hypothetical protein [Elusimicrobiota bacterium]
MIQFLKNLKSRSKIIKDFLNFLWERKLWWLIPMIITLLLIGFILIFSQGSAVAPFIYTLF